MKQLLLLSLLLSFQSPAISQDQHKIDSLKNELKNFEATKENSGNRGLSMSDTTKANILYTLSKSYWDNAPDKAIDYANQCLALSNQIGFKKGMSNAYSSMGVTNFKKGEYLQALDFHKKSIKISEEINDKAGISFAYLNIGNIYSSQGNLPEALKNFFASLKIAEETGDKQILGWVRGNIGIAYEMQDNYDDALKNHFASLKIMEETGNQKGISASFNNIGEVYRKQGNYPEALKNYLSAVKISKETGNKNWEAIGLMNIGLIYGEQKKYPEALQNLFASLSIMEEIGDKQSIAISYTNIGKIFIKLKKYNDASQYLDKGLSLSKEIGSLEWIEESYGGLATLDSSQGNFKQALDDYKMYVTYRDSLFNEENTQKTVQEQMQYDFDKKQVSDSLTFAKEKEVASVKLQKQKAYTYSGLFGIVITIILLLFMYRGYNKQRIANQKLKDAQEQLIKSEKMAAFGVMASRVSHEIQNPLNFVNNFSELSQEMVTDVIKSQSEEDKKQHADILIANLQKINEHGKRAAGIVKQLQEHSMKGTAQEFFEQ